MSRFPFQRLLLGLLLTLLICVQFLQPCYSAPKTSHTHMKDHHPTKSVVRSFKNRVPEYCRESFETIKCFEGCQEDPRITAAVSNILTEEEIDIGRDTLAQLAIQVQDEEIERAKKTQGLNLRVKYSFPCENKCESDPLYWICIEQCHDYDHTSTWETDCFTHNNDSGTCNMQSVNLVHPDCLGCLINSTRERLYTSCPYGYLPGHSFPDENLCHLLSDCDSADPTVKGTTTFKEVVEECANSAQTKLDEMRLCVNDRIMINQWKCCHSKAMQTALKCTDLATQNEIDQCADSHCEKVFSPRLCLKRCALVRNKDIQRCMTAECQFYYNTDESICDRCNSTTTTGQEFQRDSDCVNKCPRGEVNCVDNCFTQKPPPQYLIDNCHLRNYIHGFAKYVLGSENSDSDLELENLQELSSWMNHHKLPLECEDCDHDEYLRAIDVDDLEELCQLNPFRIIDFMASAMIQGNPSLRTFDFFKIKKNVKEYVTCAEKYSYGQMRTELYKLIYEYDKSRLCTTDYCNDTTSRNWKNHPYAVANMKCQIFHCQMAGASTYCKTPPYANVMYLEDFHLCHWKLDFAKWDRPRRLWAHYFDELEPADIRRNLEFHEADLILPKTKFGVKETFYTFPYFLVFRSICEGQLYHDRTYATIRSGKRPIVETRYSPRTNREFPKGLFLGVFKSALINLDRDNDNADTVPPNPATIRIGRKEIGCRYHLCYPAYAVPLMYHNTPSFNVDILDLGFVTQHKRTVYVSPYHSRVRSGRGELYEPTDLYIPELEERVSNPITPHAGHLFPKHRATFAGDQELNYHQQCFATDDTNNTNTSYPYWERLCPELEHTLDDYDNKYEDDPFSPMRPEDILRSQLTYGTAPTQVIAGFYDPNFLIIGDADMNNFDIADWSKLLLKLELDTGSWISCIQTEFRNKMYRKPIYSLLDRTDPEYPINYYRLRYAAKAYATTEEMAQKDNFAETAFFEVIGLKDRLLLVTTRGLVPFYGHTNATVYKDIAWTYKDEEILNKCFKIVRILPSAQPDSDLIVGITYEYMLDGEGVSSRNESWQNETGAGNRTFVSQEIWVGRFTHDTEPIEWSQIATRQNETYSPESISLTATGTRNEKLVTFPPHKDPWIPIELQEVKPRSEIEAICFKAYRTVINSERKNDVCLKDEAGWCTALDATPVQNDENLIQVLVRLTTYHKCSNNPIYFYLVATHRIDPDSPRVKWLITAVIPRYPCPQNHYQAVKNVFLYNYRYFQSHRTDSQGCWDKPITRAIFLHGMTYTRKFSQTLYLYGTQLLQSHDRGQNWLYVLGFPARLTTEEGVLDGTGTDRHVHRITRMAFDEGGHYAFLTNKLELWFGSDESKDVIRLRPSPMHGMIQVGVSEERNIHDGIPFTVAFDAGNVMYEMVAIVGKEGHISRIVRRRVMEWTILKGGTLMRKFAELEETNREEWKEKLTEGVEPLVMKHQTPYKYNKREWTTLCSYTNPSMKQNFSRAHLRTRSMFFPAPVQHHRLGLPHTHSSLLAFQASTFGLVWNNFINAPTAELDGTGKDSYMRWLTNRTFGFQAIFQEIKFSEEWVPEKDRLYIEPYRFRPLILSKQHSTLLNNYYIDFNVTIEFRLEFSVRDVNDVVNPEFEDDQINSIDINVENANSLILETDTEKEVRAQVASVLFIVRIRVKTEAEMLGQVKPGENLIRVPMTFHFMRGFGSCVIDFHRAVGDKVATLFYVGCPPNYELVIDWRRSIDSIALKTDRLENVPIDPYKRDFGLFPNCYDGNDVCISGRSPITLFFEIFDQSKRNFVPYYGNYTMRVIGGGPSKTEIEEYTAEEIEAFNFPGISDVSAIWASTDTKDEIGDSHELRLTSGKSTIEWTCRILSPCARKFPKRWLLETVFWVRLRISNKGLGGNSTLCLFEKEVDVMLYGFDPSPELELIISMLFFFIFVLVLYTIYVCTRKEMKVWIATKARVRNWYFVLKNGFPKKLCFYEPPLPEDEKSRRLKTFRGSKTSVGSAGSHGTPKFHPGDSAVPGIHVEENVDIIQQTHKPNTFSQLMYNQLLGRRLRKIVEKNLAMRANLIQRASEPKEKKDLEQEDNYARQFGKTVSQEDVFTPPIPKDKNRKSSPSVM